MCSGLAWRGHVTAAVQTSPQMCRCLRSGFWIQSRGISSGVLTRCLSSGRDRYSDTICLMLVSTRSLLAGHKVFLDCSSQMPDFPCGSCKEHRQQSQRVEFHTRDEAPESQPSSPNLCGTKVHFLDVFIMLSALMIPSSASFCIYNIFLLCELSRAGIVLYLSVLCLVQSSPDQLLGPPNHYCNNVTANKAELCFIQLKQSRHNGILA